jgi:hypothetical protein
MLLPTPVFWICHWRLELQVYFLPNRVKFAQYAFNPLIKMAFIAEAPRSKVSQHSSQGRLINRFARLLELLKGAGGVPLGKTLLNRGCVTGRALAQALQRILAQALLSPCWKCRYTALGGQPLRGCRPFEQGLVAAVPLWQAASNSRRTSQLRSDHAPIPGDTGHPGAALAPN